MATNTIRVSLEADARDFEQGFDRAQAKSVGLGSAVGTLAGNVAFQLGSRAVGAITDFVGQSAEAFTNLEQAVGGTEAVFGDSSAAIDEYARDSARSVGLSEAAFRTATTGIGGQLKRMTGDVDFAAQHSVILTETAADLAATYGGTTKEAVEALGSAFRGEADPAERFNLDLKVGRVNAKALELGLAATTSEIDDQARAQAILALIAEQSADAQGQFARESETAAGRAQILTAEIEDQQAAVGESAKEWELFWMQQKSNVAVGGAVVLNWFSAFSDDVTGAERDLRDFEIRTGQTADTAAAAVTIWKKYGTSVLDLIPIMKMSRDELVKLRDADEDYLKSLGWTEQGIKDVDAALEEQIRKVDAQAQATQSAGDIIAGNLVPAEKDLEEATEDANFEIRTQNELLREARSRVDGLVNPALDYVSAQQDLAAAQKAYNDAVEEFGENSPEAVTAAQNIARANGRIQDAVVAIGEKGVPAAMNALRSMGVPEAVITKFGNDKRRIEEIFRNMVIRIGVTAPTLYPTEPAGGGVGWESESKTYYARGGIMRQRTEFEPGRVGGEAGPETITPLTAAGLRPWAQALIAEMGGAPANASPTIIYLTVNALDPHAAQRAVVEAIQIYARNNDGLPVKVRAPGP